MLARCSTGIYLLTLEEQMDSQVGWVSAVRPGQDLDPGQDGFANWRPAALGTSKMSNNNSEEIFQLYSVAIHVLNTTY